MYVRYTYMYPFLAQVVAPAPVSPSAATEHRDVRQRGVHQYRLEVKQDAGQTPRQHGPPGQHHRRRSARHEPVDHLHVRGGRDTPSFERRTDATSGDPKRERLAGCCYRAHPATQHVYQRGSIRNDLHRWSHPMLRPSDSA